MIKQKRDKNILTLVTKSDGESSARDVAFMVGDRELGHVLGCEINPLKSDEILTATITVAIKFGG